MITLLIASLSVLASSSSMKAQEGKIQENAGQASDAELKTLKQKASYLVGFDIGEDIVRRELDVDYDVLIKGILDAVNKKNPPLTRGEMESVMKEFEKQVTEKANAKWTALAKSNMEKGTAFLSRNKLADGVIQLEDGLQYKVVKAAKGAKPKNGDRVKIHVIGKHVDGSSFEDTYETKMPVVVTVGATLRGLDEGLRRMNVGEKWELYIPADKGFGQRGSPPAVGPNETLIYVVELVEIVKK